MKKEYIKNYLGIVVQNNDPLKRGRVKVWVPHVEMTVYEGWNNTQENRQFNFPGANNFSGLDANIIEQLRMSLPWAEVAMPMVGSGGSSGIYNSILDRGTISDKSEYLSEGLDFIDQKKKDELERAKKEIGEWKPIDKNRLDLLAREDGLPKTKGKKFPEMEDDVFVLGTKPAKLYQSIYDSHENDKSSLGAAPDYPGKFENGTNRNDKEYQASRDDMIYRSKYSLVQRGGAITIVNTTEREILNLTHFSGSYKEFNNYTNTEFAANNDQRLVMNDAFYTVNGHRSEYVGGDYDIIIKGAYRVTFGDPKNHKEPLSQIKRLMEDFHKKYNLPFEIQRSILDDYGGQSGEFTSCPTCTKAIYASLENVADQVTQSIYSPSCPSETNLMPSPKAYSLVSVPTLECMTCGGTGKSPSTQDGSWGQNPNKASMTEALIDLQNRMFQYEEQLGNTEDNIMNYGKNQHIVVSNRSCW